jgi:dihydrofolate reductase/thymidylate synthase
MTAPGSASEFAIVVAADAERGIGKDGDLPWHLPGDLAYFKALTTETSTPGKRNAVIMGRKTWESIPPRFRPLQRRLNAVVTRQPGYAIPDGVVRADSLDDALRQVTAPPLAATVERVFVVGGGAIYAEAITHPACARVYLTRIEASFSCDTFFPALDDAYCLESRSEPRSDGAVRYAFELHSRRTG